MGRRVFPGSGALPVLMVLCLVGGAWGAPQDADPLRVTSSGMASVRFGVVGLDPVWRTAGPAGDPVRHELLLPGFTADGGPGGPRVPVRGAWVVVPPGTRPELVVHAEDWQDGGDRRLPLAPVPATRLGRGPGGNRLENLRLLPGEPVPDGYVLTPAVTAARLRASRPRTGVAVELGEVGSWRGRRVVAVRLVPVRHDGDGRVSGVLAGGDWEIRFVPDGEAGPPRKARRRSTINDSRFAGIFLNPDLLEDASTEATHHRLAVPAARPRSGANKAATLLAPEVRLGVTATRLYRVSAQRLRGEGLLPDTQVHEDQIRLYQRRYLSRLDDGSGDPPYAEVEVPIRMVGEGDFFDGDDFFVFYGLRMRDDTDFTADVGAGPETVPGCGDNGEWNNLANIYWLAAATPDTDQEWARMAQATLLAADPGQAERNYRRTEHHEEQKVFRVWPQDGGDRTYYNQYLDTSLQVSMSPQWSPDPDSPNPVDLAIGAAAFSEPLDPVLTVSMAHDGTITGGIGSIVPNEMTDEVYNLPSFDASLLSGLQPMIDIQRAAGLFSWINWVRISYDAFYNAVNNRLDFHSGAAAGPRHLEVSGFTDGDIGLIEVTDPRAPVWVNLAGANVSGSNQNWRLSIRPDQAAAGSPRSFRAVGSFNGLGVGEFDYHKSVVAEDPTIPVDLEPVRDIDLLVVTHEDFAGALQRWVDHRVARSGGDLSVHVVHAGDLFDWYGGGMRSPWAIKHLVEHARDQWHTWSLVMVGDANENALQLGALEPARTGWSRDWLPTHYHTQNVLYGEHELMATDKWFVTSETGDTDATDDFPVSIRSPWEMYTGRFPVNSVDELNNLIDKIILMESPADGQDWRRRGVFMADDEWSEGYGAESLTALRYNPEDEMFLVSERDLVATPWADETPIALDAELLRLKDWLDPYFTIDHGETRPSFPVREAVRLDGAAATLRNELTNGGQGCLVAHYQGHANMKVLASEYWLRDDALNDRYDISNINNDNPFVFFGMGCHVSDWAQDTVTGGTAVKERSLGEKFLVNSRQGAVATYGSSGYEFIDDIAHFCGVMTENWVRRPPVSSVDGGSNRSRWVLGELMWAAEGALLATDYNDSGRRGMVAQFVILGDPLMRLDGGSPQGTAMLRGSPDQEVSGEVDLLGLDPVNERDLEIAVRDEAGIQRLRVVDSDNEDLTSQVVVTETLLDANGHREYAYELRVPVRPFGHTIEVGVWDTGAPLPEDRHWSLILNVKQEAELLADNEPVDFGFVEFEPDVPVEFFMRVTSAAYLSESMSFEITSADPENLIVSNAIVSFVNERNLEATFTATAPPGSVGERAVILTIDGIYHTTWVLQAELQAPSVKIEQVFNFPNPMGSSTRFVYKTVAERCQGRIRVFSTAGHTVARIPVVHDPGPTGGVVEWDGRDAEGDRLANGTYLYRVELDAPGGQIVSAVQRLVVMR